jgi:hypothetical protein
MKEAFASAPKVESRREQRYQVFWRARLHLPGGRTIDARLSDISGGGLGLTAGEPPTLGSIVPLTMGVPDADGGPQVFAVQCSVRVVNVVLSGRDYRVGALWVDPPANVRQVLDDWIRKMRQASWGVGTS